MPFHHLHNGLIYICMSYNFCSVTCTVGNVKTIVEFSAALKQQYAKHPHAWHGDIESHRGKLIFKVTCKMGIGPHL